MTELERARFFIDEIMGELGWCDELTDSGIDPLAWARKEIQKMKRAKSVDRCKNCGSLLEQAKHCDTCGTFQ